MDLGQLKQLSRTKKRLRYLFFWGHRPERDGSIGSGCLSQWWPASFVVEGRSYATAEHFMMAEKARLFDDDEVLERILDAKSPGAAKAFGREVRGFDDEAWQSARVEIVCRGNVAKFEQNADIGRFLFATGKRVLVEASPSDCIWGIGLAKNDPRVGNALEWRGLNLLGFALMDVRQRLRGAREEKLS